MMAQKEKDFESFLKDINSRFQKIDSSSTLQAVFKTQTSRIRQNESKIRNKSNEEIIKQKQEVIDQLEKVSKDFAPKVALKAVKKLGKKLVDYLRNKT